MKTLYSVLYDTFHPFQSWGLFDNYVVIHRGDQIPADANGMLLVHGGADIHPDYYKKGRSSMSGAGSKPSQRDRVEWDCMVRANEIGLPIFGICRGAQMLCALAGGHLIQHVDGHTGRDHKVVDKDGEEYYTVTCHHQQMWPFDVQHEMLAWAPPLSKRYIDVETNVVNDIKVDPEAIWFPTVKGLAVQWHPEWMPADDEQAVAVKQWVQTYINI